MTEAEYYALFEAYARGGAGRARPRRAAGPPGCRPHAGATALRRLSRPSPPPCAAAGQRQALRQQLAATSTREMAQWCNGWWVRQGDGKSIASSCESAPSPPTHPLLRSCTISRTERRLRDFWNGHRATIGVAASVAVLAVFSTLLGLEWWRAAKTCPLALRLHRAAPRNGPTQNQPESPLAHRAEPQLAPVTRCACR